MDTGSSYWLVTVNNLKVLYSSASSLTRRSKTGKIVSWSIHSESSRILDALDMLDEFYVNLLSWSDTNVLAVVHGRRVYLWNVTSGDIQELCTFDDGADSYMSSVLWVQKGGAHLTVGSSAWTTQLWDVQAWKRLRFMDGHTDCVGALSWNRHILSSGGCDSVIISHDVFNHSLTIMSNKL